MIFKGVSDNPEQDLVEEIAIWLLQKNGLRVNIGTLMGQVGKIKQLQANNGIYQASTRLVNTSGGQAKPDKNPNSRPKSYLAICKREFLQAIISIRL